MKRKLLLIAALVSLGASAETVLLVGKQAVAVSPREDRAWKKGDAACVERDGEEIACGSVSKASAKGAILVLKFQREKPLKGDLVRPKDRVPASASPDVMSSKVSVEAETRDFSFTVGAMLSPSYFIPAFEFQYHLTGQLAIGILTGYLTASTTNFKVTALPFAATIAYYMRGDFEGLWVEGALGAYLFSISGATADESPKSLAAIATVGYRFAIAGMFSLGLAAGVQYLPTPTSDAIALDFGSVQPLGLLQAGIKF